MDQHRSLTPIIPPRDGVKIARDLRAAMGVPVPHEKRTRPGSAVAQRKLGSNGCANRRRRRER